MNGFSLKPSVFAVLTVAMLAAEGAYAINCKVRVGTLNFGVYVPLATSHLDVIGRFEVRCQAQPGTFSVSIGPGLSGNQLVRTMSAGGGVPPLLYNLYRDAARTQIWGDGNPPTFVVTGARTSKGRPTFFNYPIYGRIFAKQAPEPGKFSDRLLVTVLF